MRTVGIICEYDPFHRGHRRQFQLIREQVPDAVIICLMSGPFTQRGTPALFAPAFRAGAALQAGADLVLELPCAFAVRDAEHFALGGIDLFNRLGMVDMLSFGCEDKGELLLQAAKLLEHPTGKFLTVLHDETAKGLSFPSAQGNALQACLGHSDIFEKPNNILAICYLRALERTKSAIKPLPVRRKGNYHEEETVSPEAPSAASIRNAWLNGNTVQAETGCDYPLKAQPFCRPEALDQLLIWALRNASPRELSKLPDCREGLENRLWEAARQSRSREELLIALKTKRYSYARLSRLCCHALLGISEDFLLQRCRASYARILAIRPERVGKLLRETKLPIISKAADTPQEDPLFRLDENAYELWALGAGLPAGLLYRQKISTVTT